MKKNMLLLGLLLLAVHLLPAQTTDYRVVFDCTSKDTLDHKTAIRWLNEIAENHPEAHTELVLFGQGINMAVKGQSTVSAELERLLASNKNISVRVCAIALKSHHIDPSQLLTGVTTVPDGIYEVISKQREGWGYIKVMH